MAGSLLVSQLTHHRDVPRGKFIGKQLFGSTF